MSSSTILPSIFHFLTSSDATWSFASIAFMATFLVFFLGYLLLEPSRRRRRLLAYTTAFSLFFNLFPFFISKEINRNFGIFLSIFFFIFSFNNPRFE